VFREASNGPGSLVATADRALGVPRGRAQRQFEAAARTLAVTPSAISHQVRALEQWFGKPLFLRQVRHVELTRDGRAFLKVVDHSFGRIRTAADRPRAAESARATLRISALPLFTSAWLIPRLEAFERAHPNIVLDIESTNRVVDFGREPRKRCYGASGEDKASSSLETTDGVPHAAAE